jgi:hypothetical protein
MGLLIAYSAVPSGLDPSLGEVIVSVVLVLVILGLVIYLPYRFSTRAHARSVKAYLEEEERRERES